MSSQNIAETQMLIKFIEKLPFTQKDKKAWMGVLQEDGINDELLAEVKEKFLKLPKSKFTNDWARAKSNMEFTTLTRRWQMSKASKNFHKTH
jgi:hypothetical protein